MKAPFKITNKLLNGRAPYRYLVIEGTGMVREVVSRHTTVHAAFKAAAKWVAPAQVVVLDSHSWEEISAQE